MVDFGSCLSCHWLSSPESELHGFPLITPYPADLFTIVFWDQCLHLAYCFIGCFTNSSFLPVTRVMSWLVAFLALRALPTLNIIPCPCTALTSLAGNLSPACHPSRGPSRVFFHSNLTLVVGVNDLRYYAIPRDRLPCPDCSDYSSGNRNPRC